MVASHSLTLITAADCHICEHARKVLTSVSREMALVVREVGWESEQGRSFAKRDGVPFPPAVYVNGVLAGYGRVSERALRKKAGGGSGLNALVYSSSLAAAFLGGILALFAPCCVVSVLPTFVGAALKRGRIRLPVTAAIFAAGVATVMLPIVLGVGLLGQLLAAHHRLVFFVVGLFLSLLGIQVISGRPWSLPMPMLRLRISGSSTGGIYALGLTSGFASSCCAPVLAGVVAVSALAGSVTGSLGLGIAYVFGMVFPLLVAVLFWDRFELSGRLRWLPSVPRLHIGFRRLPWSDAIAAAMILGIGGLALYIAYTGQSTYLPDWLSTWNRWATGVAGDLAAALRGTPVAVQAVALAGLVAAVSWAVYRTWRSESPSSTQPAAASASTVDLRR